MARLFTRVDVATADVEPREPHELFGQLTCDEQDRCLLVMGLDAARPENGVPQVLGWFADFQAKWRHVDPRRVQTMIFVLDWPGELLDTPQPRLDSDSIHVLMRAGLCWRPKDPNYYDDRSIPLVNSLCDDLRAKRLIHGRPTPLESGALVLEVNLRPASAPRPEPDLNDPGFRESLDFLASPIFVWPEEAVRELLRR